MLLTYVIAAKLIFKNLKKKYFRQDWFHSLKKKKILGIFKNKYITYSAVISFQFLNRNLICELRKH